MEDDLKLFYSARAACVLTSVLVSLELQSILVSLSTELGPLNMVINCPGVSAYSRPTPGNI